MGALPWQKPIESTENPIPLPADLKQILVIDQTEKHRECYELRQRGKTHQQLAKHFGVSTKSIQRWLKEYAEKTREALEGQSQLNLIVSELQRLELREEWAWAKANESKNETRQATFCNLANKIQRTRIELLTNVGLIEKTPEKHWQLIEHNRPQDPSAQDRANRTDEEVVESIIQLVKSTPDI